MLHRPSTTAAACQPCQRSANSLTAAPCRRPCSSSGRLAVHVRCTPPAPQPPFQPSPSGGGGAARHTDHTTADQQQQPLGAAAAASADAAAAPPAGCPAHQAPTAAAASPSSHLPAGGARWRVLPHGNVDGLPPVPCRPGGAPTPDQPAGEYGELEAAGGAAPFLLRRFRELGPVFSWWMGQDSLTTVLDYEAIRSLLQLGDGKLIAGWNPESFYLMLGQATRRGLEDPPTRMANRRRLQPGLTREALAGYTDKLVAICHAQLAAWAAAGRPTDLAAEGNDLSFQFSTQLLVDFDITPSEAPTLRAKFDRLFEGLFAPPDPTPAQSSAAAWRRASSCCQTSRRWCGSARRGGRATLPAVRTPTTSTSRSSRSCTGLCLTTAWSSSAPSLAASWWTMAPPRPPASDSSSPATTRAAWACRRCWRCCRSSQTCLKS